MNNENEHEHKEYVATPRKKNDESLYKKYTFNNIILVDFDKILKDYITTHIKKFDFHFINCDLKIEFDNKFSTIIETKFFNNIDSDKIKSFLLCYIDCFKSRGYKFYIINRMTINSISDRCNMTYEHCRSQPMSICELQVNLNVAKNPQLANSLS